MVSEGWIVENFIYKDIWIKVPFKIACDKRGRIYVLNKEGDIFLIEKDKKASKIFHVFVPLPLIQDMIVDSKGNIFILEKRGVYKINKKGKLDLVYKIDDKINPRQLVIDYKDRVYLIDTNSSSIYLFKNKIKELKLFSNNLQIIGIDFDRENNIYILNAEKKFIFIRMEIKPFKILSTFHLFITPPKLVLIKMVPGYMYWIY